MSALFESVCGLTLLDPWMLLLALLVPLALFVRRRRGRPAVLFAPSPLLFDAGPGPSATPLSSSWRRRLAILPPTLGSLGLLLVVVALARPARREPLPIEARGIDILLCLDTSSSMTATDMGRGRNRLETVEKAAERFIAGRPDDSVGLITFARYPDVRCPPTRDHAALAEILSAVTPVEADGPEDATGIGTAVARAAQVLRSSKAPSRVVILLTDGEENVATAQTPDEIAPLHAGQLCRKLGVRVYTIAAGIGRRDQTGRWIPIDTTQVSRLAEMTGGEFHEAPDARAIADVYARIDELEKIEQTEPRTRTRDRFTVFLGLALALFAGSRLLGILGLEAMP